MTSVETEYHGDLSIRAIRAIYTRRKHNGYGLAVNTGQGLLWLRGSYRQEHDARARANELYNSPAFDIHRSYSR